MNHIRLSRNLFTLLIQCLFFNVFLNAQTFKDVAVSVGINSGFGFGPQSGGISLSDFNQDGWDDLTYATERGRKIEFYVNNKGTFELIEPLVDDTSHVRSVLWVDLDNDGDKELFITSFTGQNKLYENLGPLNLIDITDDSGISIVNDPSYGASFGDYDLDGLLDLYSCNYYENTFTNHFYRNDGGLRFTDVTQSSGLFAGPNFSFQGSFIDYNNDLKPDLYVAVDKAFNNLLFENNGDGTFNNVSLSSGAGIIIDAMNSGGGDYDNDGDLDLYVTNTPSGNVFLKNNGDGTFSDVTTETNTGFFRVGWAANFFDQDNDGDLDLYVSTNDPAEPNALYINNGDGTFSEPLLETGGLDGNDVYYSFCNTQGDYNHDGQIDIVLSNGMGDPFVLWENRNASVGNWLKVKLEGTESNRDGIGTWFSAFCGDELFTRYSFAGDGFLGQRSDYLHVGIGDNLIIDSIVIEWPSGILDKYYDVIPKQAFEVIEGTSVSNPQPCPLVLAIDNSTSGDQNFAQLLIESVADNIDESGIIYSSGGVINLKTGFSVSNGTEFSALIEGCEN